MTTDSGTPIGFQHLFASLGTYVQYIDFFFFPQNSLFRCCPHLEAVKTLDSSVNRVLRGSVSILHPRPIKIHRMLSWLARFSQAGALTLSYTWQTRHHMWLEEDMKGEMPSAFLDSNLVAAMQM